MEGASGPVIENRVVATRAALWWGGAAHFKETDMERTLVVDNEREVTSDGVYLLSRPLGKPAQKHIDANRAVVELVREKSKAWERPPDITLDASQLANIAAWVCDDGYTISLWFSGKDEPIVIAAGRKKQPELGEQETFGILMPVVDRGIDNA